MTTTNGLTSRQKVATGGVLAIGLVALIYVALLRGGGHGLLYAIILLVAAGAGLVLLLKPWLGTMSVIVSFPFVAALPRGALFPGVKLDEVLILASLLAFLIRPGPKRLRFSKIDAAYLFMFLAGTLMPTVGILARGQTTDWLEVVALLKQYALLLLVVLTLRHWDQLQTAVTWLLLPSLLVALLALLQLLDAPGMRALLANIYYDGAAAAVYSGRVLRATATLGNWNALGGYGAFGACLSLALVPCRKALTHAWLAPVALAANVGILVLSGSSNSLFGFLCGALVWWMFSSRRFRLRKRYVLYAVLVLAVGASVIAAGGQKVLERQIQRQTGSLLVDRVTGEVVSTGWVPYSVLGRWLLVKHLLQTMVDDGLAVFTGFGAGPDARALLPWGTAESGYMTMLFFYGPLYLLAYVLLMVAIVSQARRIRRHLPSDDELGRALVAGVISITTAIAVMNLIHSYFIAAGVTHYFWIAVGLMVVLARLYRYSPAVSVLPGESRPL
jgi:hypothetical protein